MERRGLRQQNFIFCITSKGFVGIDRERLKFDTALSQS